MIRAMHGKSQYCGKVANTLFGSLLSPSQELITMLLYRNGYQKWVWMHNGYVSSGASEGSDGDTSYGSLGYIYTERTSDLTSRNGGWSRLGMLKYNDLYEKVKETRVADDGVYDRECMMDWVEKRTRSKRRHQLCREYAHGINSCPDLEYHAL
jgi:hypothetical protein